MDILEIMKKNEPYCAPNRAMPEPLQKKAKQLCWEYNQTGPMETEKRAALLRRLLGACTPLTYIEPTFHCDYGFNIYAEGLAVINYNCVILDTSPVRLGDGAFLAPGVCLACAGHSIDAEQRTGQGINTSAPITLEPNVWIGANSVVCGGVTIGEGSVIGAGSVVTHDIPAGVVAAGSPCRVLRAVTPADRLEPLALGDFDAKEAAQA